MASLIQTSQPTYSDQASGYCDKPAPRYTGTIVMDRETALAHFTSSLRFKEIARPQLSRKFGALALLAPALLVGLVVIAGGPTLLIAPMLIALGAAMAGFWFKYLAVRRTEVRVDCIVHRIGRLRTVEFKTGRIRGLSRRQARCGRVEIVIRASAGKAYGIPTRRPAELADAISRLTTLSGS